MSAVSGVLLACYWTAVAGLFVYGINCYVLSSRYLAGRRENLARLQRVRERHRATITPSALPIVTVQLPVYNERFVAGRLIDAVCGLRYPRERLQIQVLDDSTDDTSAIVARHVARHADAGIDIQQCRREHRAGYKAGALRDGLGHARGELIAIFDADFVPLPDFLEQVIPFFGAHDVGLVQARWGHLNREWSALTRAQAVAIDGHFGIEQPARCWAGLLLNFNGTAGVWRRAAIDAAGGWQADTLTEDLDLSYRAQLAGWRIEYLPDVEVPAELPVDVSAFKSQQRRWAKGSIQTARKLLPRVLAADLRPFAKLQAMLHLTHYLIHPLMLVVALLAVPVLLTWQGSLGPAAFGIVAAMLVAGTCGPSTLYVTSQRALHRDWRTRLRSLPMLMILGTGIAVSNTRAVLEAFLGVKSGFVRTPKRCVTDESSRRATRGYALPRDTLPLMEAALALWSAFGLWIYLREGKYLIGPFLLLYTCGFGYVAWSSFTEGRRWRRGGLMRGLRAAFRIRRPFADDIGVAEDIQ